MEGIATPQISYVIVQYACAVNMQRTYAIAAICPSTKVTKIVTTPPVLDHSTLILPAQERAQGWADRYRQAGYHTEIRTGMPPGWAKRLPTYVHQPHPEDCWTVYINEEP